MLIHHYVPFTSNVGDLFVRDGIHARLREQFPGAVIKELPANDPHRRSQKPVGLIGANLELTNAEAQLVIVGGSNMYEGPEWKLMTSVDAINAINVPLAFIGLGVGSVRGDRVRPLTEKSKAEIRASHKKAIGVAVRDQASVEFLEELGLQGTMTACPATFVGRNPMRIRKPKHVVVSAPPARFLPKWGHRGYFRSKVMISTFTKVLQSLSKQSVTWEVIAHDDRDIEFLMPMLEIFGKKPLYFGNDPAPFYEEFKKADVAVCYRLHMGISCLGWGVPFWLINFDLRTEAFRDTYGIGELSFDAFSLTDSRRLKRAVGSIKSFPSATERQKLEGMHGKREYYWSVTCAFYQGLVSRLGTVP